MAKRVDGRLPRDETLDAALALGRWLLRGARPPALGMALAQLGDIDLPPTMGEPADQERLRILPPLYLAAELEAALLLPAAETVAGLFASGGLPAELGPAARPVLVFWRGRHTRLAAGERQALFGQLFGSPGGPVLAGRMRPNADFENELLDLCESLHQITLTFTGGISRADEALVRTRAMVLASNLSQRAGGLATFAAGELLRTVQEAIDLLKEPAVQRAVGAPGLWQAVRNVAQRYLDRDPQVNQHVARGKAGMIVLTWLADSALLLEQPGRAILTPAHPVLPAATAWLQASLDLAEEAPASQGTLVPQGIAA